MALIEVRGLRKTYGRTVAVDSLDLDVAEGQVVGVLGPNGAGKTTTVECVAGLTRPDAGTVTLAGHVPWRDRVAVTRLLGVQLQSSGLPAKLTAREAVQLVAACHDDPVDPDELVDRLGLGPVAGTRYAKLSGGQQQRLAIATALVGRPRVVVLDELTTGLDPEARRHTWDLVRDVRDRGTTVVLVTHLMEEAQQLCDRITVVAGGRVVAEGTPDEVVAGRSAATTMTFVPTAALPPGALDGLPGVASVRRAGDRVEVTGSDDGVRAVLRALTAHGAEPAGLRVAASTLDEAYLELVRSTAPEGTR
jgi:ABC-2 type transport system ATP-binding protein